MKMKQKKRSFLVLLTLCALSLALCVGAVPVSPALDVLALDYKMIKVGLTSRDVYFDESDFLKATGLSAIDGICIESLPEPSLGTLMLGSLALREGQTVSKKNLSNIRFVPGESGELEARCVCCRALTHHRCRQTLTIPRLRFRRFAVLRCSEA